MIDFKTISTSCVRSCCTNLEVFSSIRKTAVLLLETAVLLMLSLNISAQIAIDDFSVFPIYDDRTELLNHCDIACDANTPITISGTTHTIIFAGVEYDYVNCKSYFYYCIDDNESPGISHVIFGENDCESTCLDDPENTTVGTWTIDDTTCDITQVPGNGAPTQGQDPTTGICGVKFDQGGSAMYFLCVDGIQPVGTIQFAIKAGPNEYFTDVPGPEDCEECTPVLDCPDDVTVECDESIDPAVLGEATITNNCEAEITYNDVTISDDGCTEVIERTWTATPPCEGRTPVTCVQTITITDTEAPEIVDIPDYTLPNCNQDWPTSLSTTSVTSSAAFPHSSSTLNV